MSTLPARLAALRDTAGISANELGLLAGLSHYTVTTIETAKSPNPNLATVAKLAAVLGDTGNWILTGAGKPPGEKAIAAAVQTARTKRAERLGSEAEG